MAESQRQFGKALKATVRRVDHVRQRGEGEVASLTELLRQHEGDEYEDGEQFDENHSMRMLRYDVNSRKHAVYVRRRILHRRREAEGFAMTWATAGAERQFQIACQMFQVVVAAFEEVLRWHPEARLDDSSVRTT